MNGDERADFALAVALKAIDAAIVLPQPWETLSDVAIKGLSTLVRAAIQNAFDRKSA